MKKTKQKILDTSRTLFNELGYSQVTVRMIALKLNMSSGNLNYHFQKREDILEALYFEMVAVFDARVKELDGESLTLEKMKNDIQTSMQRMVAYRFFWTDLYNLLALNKKIRAHFEAVHQARVKGYRLLFKVFIGKGILREPSFKKEYQLLTDRLINFSNTWLYASSLYKKNKISPAFINNQAVVLLSMIFPYLTESGRQEFKNLHPKYFR